MNFNAETFQVILTDDLAGEGESSFTSNRFDIAPLCQVDELVGPCLCPRSVEAVFPAAPMYIDALPFPGRAEGRRLTITDDDRGMI